MDDRDRNLLRSLLVDQRVGALSVLVEGHPYASLVPFALSEDFGAAMVHASQLARHSRGLSTNAPFSLLVHEPDRNPDTNPAQLGRVTLQGRVRPYDRQEQAYAPARDRYLAKFPKSQMTFRLGDFTLHALEIERGRFVAGFAKTFDLTPKELQSLADL